MTNEKAIEIIKDCMILDDCFVKEAGEMAIKALEAQNKYRWHDLRKDKDDLPTDDRTVLVCIVHDYCDDDGWFTYDFGWFIESWFTNYHCRGIESQGYKVIAWREIELFEEVEDD